jgi:hypothetical protein
VLLGDTNAIVAGSGCRYDVHGFVGPLSFKSVIRGSAMWEAGGGRFEEPPNGAAAERRRGVALTLDAPHPVETFCIFFARRFGMPPARFRRIREDLILCGHRRLGGALAIPPPSRRRPHRTRSTYFRIDDAASGR